MLVILVVCSMLTAKRTDNGVEMDWKWTDNGR